MLNIECLALGPVNTNAYILKKGERAILIDPSDNAPLIKQKLGNSKLEAILLTHAHFDHIGALEDVKNDYPDAVVYSHALEERYLKDPNYNLSPMIGEAYVYEGEVQFVEDGESVNLLEENIICLHTPGHTLGSLSFYFKKEAFVFSGDALFRNSIGRTDIIGGNFDILIESIKNKLYKLPLNTLVYPGHGKETTVGNEIKNNPFVN